MKLRFPAPLVALLLALPSWAQLPAIQGEPALTPKAVAAPQLRLGIAQLAASRVQLDPVTDAEVEALRSRNAGGPKGSLQRRVTVGVARPVSGALGAARAFSWLPVPGGYAAQVAVTSPSAGSLRLAVDLAGVPTDVEMVFFGSDDPARLEGPVRVGEIQDRTRSWWSPLTEGETQTIEFFVPGAHAPPNLPLAVAGASHLFTTPSSRFTKRIQDIGTSGSCNVDLPCSPLASNSAFRNAANSTAQMVFVDGGFTVICTGTLLADGDTSSQVPWFYSANHCFENEDPPYKTAAQMQVVANTLTTLWGFEASACNSRTVRSGWTQLTGGATLIHNNVTSDVLFLRLRSTPPAGSFYSGWDPNPVSGGSALTSIHHPEGDLKKVSQGSMQRFAAPGVGGGNASFIETRWNTGTTEPGSSGAGVWTTSNGEYYFRGGLWGGAALCTNSTGTDFFSRLDQAYPALSSYLAAATAPTTDYTDLWWNPNEAGWGLNLVQHASRVIFAVWYTYEMDGTRTWYVMPSGSWSNATTYTGSLFTTAGPPFTAPFNPVQVESRQVGSATITFSDANNGVFSYSVDGVSGTKSITRQPF